MAAATSALGTLSGVGGAQPTEITLDGQASGWVGRSPATISGVVNPSLGLTPGQTYRVTWTNRDGAAHNFVVADSGGTQVVRSDIVDEQGASQTVEFEVTSAMTEYFCEVHPSSMRGQIGASCEQATPGTEAASTEQPPPVLDSTTIVLGGLSPYWLGLAPSALQGRRNPTLRLREGTEYELVWINLDGVEHDFHVADSNGDDLEDTSSRDDTGETQSTSFEATTQMSEYYCAFHPQSMRGDVEVV